ncbi:hypothetical protein C8F01DRAFT_1369506 [Mycena amicta]|nr:hypothetical protein C8F01DRAFT_1369506 [Mycena amicta]
MTRRQSAGYDSSYPQVHLSTDATGADTDSNNSDSGALLLRVKELEAKIEAQAAEIREYPVTLSIVRDECDCRATELKQAQNWAFYLREELEEWRFAAGAAKDLVRLASPYTEQTSYCL